MLDGNISYLILLKIKTENILIIQVKQINNNNLEIWNIK